MVLLNLLVFLIGLLLSYGYHHNRLKVAQRQAVGKRYAFWEGYTGDFVWHV